MRVLVFHGYLLRGTGSNVYNASLAAALVAAGHEVHLLCQERDPFGLGFVDAAATWEDGRLRIERRRSPERCVVYRPDIGDLLPVYVADRYAGVQARPFPELSDQELDRYIAANLEAVREVVERVRPDVALANHLIMGPVILARALAGAEHPIPYAVKVHGSALEYTVKPHPRFLPHAREGLAQARGILVGSRHTAQSLWEALGEDTLSGRTRLGPPGVDVDAFSPAESPQAAAGLRDLATTLAAAAGRIGSDSDRRSAFARDTAQAAQAVAGLDPRADQLVIFVGKLLAAKGIDLLLAAWPLVLARAPCARLVVVGFGSFGPAAQRLREALAAGDLDAARALAEAGGSDRAAQAPPLRHLLAFLEALEADAAGRRDYLAAAARMGERVVFTGRLEHSELAPLLAACEALVVPSTFPEAFGMVAAEAAACGVLPVSAEHSGLAEVSRTLAAAVPAEAAPLLSFGLGPRAVPDLADRIVRWLAAPAALREATRAALVAVARERYSWRGVAEGVIAAAQGRLDGLARPARTGPDGSRTSDL